MVPPGTGICHQVNLEYLAQTVWTKTEKEDGEKVTYAFPDTLVGTDSHTTMVNGLGVLGWGVGGIEAEAAMLGQPISMLVPEVIGFPPHRNCVRASPRPTSCSTVTQMLRKKGVVGKFVEFFGEGLDHLSLADRATIANMAPEYGATCGFFPIDKETLAYLDETGPRRSTASTSSRNMPRPRACTATSRPPIRCSPTPSRARPSASDEPSLAGPKRPQETACCSRPPRPAFLSALEGEFKKPGEAAKRQPVADKGFDVGHGDVVIAAITYSCTNTSNPSVLIGAGLLARNALKRA